MEVATGSDKWISLLISVILTVFPVASIIYNTGSGSPVHSSTAYMHSPVRPVESIDVD